jgi:hypothetical protein
LNVTLLTVATLLAKLIGAIDMDDVKYKWWILGQDHNSMASAIHEKLHREELGDKVKMRELANGKWQVLIWAPVEAGKK